MRWSCTVAASHPSRTETMCNTAGKVYDYISMAAGLGIRQQCANELSATLVEKMPHLAGCVHRGCHRT
ncbi:putative WD repeat-containing protein C9G1.05 [Fusarium oxysporum f. sp. albedinis]|nr:putative WD repeat-containing protein C9G1.05 [Fusarium oxysporum f. sp. albedinis]